MRPDRRGKKERKEEGQGFPAFSDGIEKGHPYRLGGRGAREVTLPEGKGNIY